MRYLMIENKVKTMPTVEIIRMLGASSSRGTESRIGQFGSGFPASLALLARNNMLESLKLCLGKDVYTFGVKATPARDADGNWITLQEIVMKRAGGGTVNLNISTEFGALDWKDVTMSVREFLSNALDGADQYDGTPTSVGIETITGESRLCRAKEGMIRVFIQMNDDIERYVEHLTEKFLCLTAGYDSSIRVFPNTTGGPARVYRKGVLVGEFGERSLFHYNIPDVDLKGSRIVDWSEAIDRCTQALALASTEDIALYLRASLADADRDTINEWEMSFSNWSLRPDRQYGISDTARSQASERWTEAVKEFIGDAVICETDVSRSMVVAKGMVPAVRMNHSLAELFKAYGARSSDDVLNKHEVDGRELCPPTGRVLQVLDEVWDAIDAANMTIGKPKPKAMCFHQNTVTEGAKAGYCVLGGDTIYVRSDHAEDQGVRLDSIVLEEVAHYITGSADYTRDFQEFAFKYAVIMMRRAIRAQRTARTILTNGGRSTVAEARVPVCTADGY